MPSRIPFAVETELAPGRSLLRFDRIEADLTEAEDRTALLRDRDFRRRLFGILDARLGPDGLLSLDVFDTLLLRDGSSELRRFVEIGAEMAARAGRGVAPVEAFVARHLGTRASYRAGPRVEGCGEGSLTEIHMTAARLLGLPDAMAETFVEIELGYEAGRLARNDLLADYMRRHRSLGGQVVLISDMYMHADQIARLLALCGVPGTAYDALYSSADTKVSKASGGIFARVAEAQGRKRILHVGDSLAGDYRRPREAGWDAMLLPVPRALLARRARDRAACLAELQRNHGLDLDPEIAA
jgi:FMN phosphatase YigB (HAD superfamily)